MATPTLRALRRHFGPPARLVGILRPHLAELLAGTDWLDEQWSFDPRSKQARSGAGPWCDGCGGERFDMVMLLTNSLHTALLAWLGGAGADRIRPRRPRPAADRQGLSAAAGRQIAPRRWSTPIWPWPGRSAARPSRRNWSWQLQRAGASGWPSASGATWAAARRPAHRAEPAAPTARPSSGRWSTSPRWPGSSPNSSTTTC